MTVPKKSVTDGRSSVATPTAEVDVYGLPLYARIEFLLALQRVAPKVLSSLRDDILPAFRQILSGAGTQPEAIADQRGRGAGAIQRVHHALELPLFRWASVFNLPDVKAGQIEQSSLRSPGNSALQYWFAGMPFFSLLVTVATDTLTVWAIRQAEPPLYWNLEPIQNKWRSELQPCETSLQIAISAWQPGAETREAFRQRANREFDDGLNEHIAAVDRELTASGPFALGEPTSDLAPVLAEHIRQHNRSSGPPRAVKLPGRHVPEHIDWLVKYQVLGQLWGTIAAEDRSERHWRTVKAGVHLGAERVIGPDYKSWLRVSPRGRPRKA